MSAAVVLRFHSAEPGFAWRSHPREARVLPKRGARGGNMFPPTLLLGGWLRVRRSRDAHRSGGTAAMRGAKMTVRLGPVATRHGNVELGVSPHAVLGDVQAGRLHLRLRP